MFVISRIEQYKFSDCAAVYAESERTLTRYDNPDWHPERQKDNVHLVSPLFDSGIEKHILERKKQYKCRLSIDSTLPTEKQTNCFCQSLFTASPEFFAGMTKEQTDEYFERALSFFSSSFPSVEIISAVIHYDESTPHLHINFLPLIAKRNSKGKMKTVFSSSELFKGKDFFSRYQDSFFDYMKELYPEKPLERKGEVKQDHLTIREFKAKQQELEQVKEELEEVKQLKEEVICSGGKVLDLKIANAKLKSENKRLEKDLSLYRNFLLWMENKLPSVKVVIDHFRNNVLKGKGRERD